MDLDRDVRKYVFEYFRSNGIPPITGQIAEQLNISPDSAELALRRLDEEHHLKLVPRTSRILMAFPFSAIATPYRVSVKDGHRYYANCAWDAVAFHVMLGTPIGIDSYCHDCAQPVHLELEEGVLQNASRDPPILYFGLPAAQWWTDIVYTCGATMVFFASEAHLNRWLLKDPSSVGEMISVEQALKLSEPFYRTKMAYDFTRPSREACQRLFDSLGLRGPFWEI
jgi:hypothetical protein